MASDEVIKDLREEVESSQGPEVSTIESLCLNCRENGTTKIFLTKIPFFKEVAVMSFECPHCDWTNNELQPVATVQEKGVLYKVACTTAKDLNRQIVKTEWAEVRIPEVEFEVKKQSGLITTVEGIIGRAIEGLRETLRQYMEDDDEDTMKLSRFIKRLMDMRDSKETFTFELDDPTGNSYVESLNPTGPDPAVEIKQYTRSLEQNKLIGCIADDAQEIPKDDQFNISNEVVSFATNCYNCNAPCFTNMTMTKIPHFKEVILMATNCDACGYKTNEIKSGAGIEEKGIRLTKEIRSLEDLKLDVVKSETCALAIPELEVEVRFSGSGKYTTVEGLIETIKEQLLTTNPFAHGDATPEEVKKKLDEIAEMLKEPVGLTIKLDDPCGNSFVEKADSVERYERTFDQNEELGLNDMKV